MSTEESIKRRLQEIAEIEKEIAAEYERYERIHSKGMDIGSPELTDMPRSPSPEMDKMTDLIIKLERVTEHIKELKKKRESETKWVEDILSRIKSADEKTVIRLRYLDGETWRDISFVLFGGKEDYMEREDTYERRMYEIHGNALTSMKIEDNKRHG